MDAGDILNALQGVFMGSFVARKGDWTLLTDLIYLNLAADKNNAISIPGGFGPGVNVNTDLELTGWVWTLAGGYTFHRSDRANADLYLGLRMLDMDTDAKLTLDGPLPPTLPTANLSQSVTLWDAIIGVRGRVHLSGSWFAPYRFEVGTGDSALTWQGMAGVGYGFDWGEVTLSYRHLYYDQSGDKFVQDLAFSGAEVGVNFRF